MYLKTDTITVSRIYRLLNKYGVNDIPSDGLNGLVSGIKLSNIDQDLPRQFLNILEIDAEPGQEIIIMSEYLGYLAQLTQEYLTELDNRMNFIIEKGFWSNDKQPDDTVYYRSDYYLQIFLTLSENNINAFKLNLFESMILYEDIVTNTLKESCSSLLSMLDSEKYFVFIEDMKRLLKFGNFSAFVLDIYNEIEKKYDSQSKDKTKK